MANDSQSSTEAGSPRPAKLHFRFDQQGDELSYAWNRISWATIAASLFAFLWLCGWTVGCVVLGVMVVEHRQWAMIVFAIPFWSAWLYVSGAFVVMFFSREQFVLGPEGALLRRTILGLERSEQRPLVEVREFSMAWKATGSRGQRMSMGVEAETLGLPLRFGEGLDESELLWLASRFNAHLRALRANAAGHERLAPQPPIEPGSAVTLAAAPRAFELPSDCRWKRAVDPMEFGTIVVVQHGRWVWSKIGGVLFVNLFCNSIIGVFIGILFGIMPGGNPKPVDGPMWWGLLVFLLPFEAVGLALLGTLALLLLEPVRRTIWRFDRHQVSRRREWLGFGRTQRDAVERLDRIELYRRSESKRRYFLPDEDLHDHDGSPFELRLVDTGNRMVAVFDGLTEGEARWLGDALLHERREWFR